jgi:hypothetical protein
VSPSRPTVTYVPRLDLDAIAAWTPENMRRLAPALEKLDTRLRGGDADLLGIDVTDPRQLFEGGNS